MELTIICPFHKNEEVISLPESYSPGFRGEIPCGATEDRCTILLELYGGSVKSVKLVQTPGVGVTFA